MVGLCEKWVTLPAILRSCVGQGIPIEFVEAWVSCIEMYFLRKLLITIEDQEGEYKGINIEGKDIQHEQASGENKQCQRLIFLG